MEKPTQETVEEVSEDQIISEALLSKKVEDIIDKFFDKRYSAARAAKKEATPYPAPSYSWSATRFKDGYLQPSGSTKEERYPKIYDAAAKLKPKAKRVLSFGCSTGEELFALAKRIPNAAQYVGVDIDHMRIKDARKKNAQDNIFFYDTVGGLGTFDVVTALNVFFCLENPIPKDQWQKTLEEVMEHVAPGGVLLIFKSDYDPAEILGTEFKAENTWIHEHNRNKKNYFCGYYRKKRKFWG